MSNVATSCTLYNIDFGAVPGLVTPLVALEADFFGALKRVVGVFAT